MMEIAAERVYGTASLRRELEGAAPARFPALAALIDEPMLEKMIGPEVAAVVLNDIEAYIAAGPRADSLELLEQLRRLCAAAIGTGNPIYFT
jgi:hypothetical protein